MTKKVRRPQTNDFPVVELVAQYSHLYWHIVWICHKHSPTKIQSAACIHCRQGSGKPYTST